MLLRFSKERVLGKNQRTEIRRDRRSGDPVFSESIFVGVETSEFRRVSEGMRALQMKMKKCSWMLLSGFMLMDVQEGRF